MRYLIKFVIFQMCLGYVRSLDRGPPTYSAETFRSYYLRQVLCQATTCRKCQKVVIQFSKRDRKQKVNT